MEELKTTQDAIEKQNIELGIKNNMITASIQAAVTIQNVILPSKHKLNAIFPDNFIIYRPKDIVSGDFFWVFEDREKNIKIASVVDCTGHGVPGAFMSLVGADILSDTIEIKGERSPAKILTALNYNIRKKLNQASGKSNEGMDLVICAFEKQTNGTVKMDFASAKGKMYLVIENEFHELKGDRKAIGGKFSEDYLTFSKQTVVLKPGSMLYLFSDGFIDQANRKRKSFSSTKFKALIAQHYNKPLAEQKKIFEDALERHQGKEVQRDDITVLGLKI